MQHYIIQLNVGLGLHSFIKSLLILDEIDCSYTLPLLLDLEDVLRLYPNRHRHFSKRSQNAFHADCTSLHLNEMLGR